MPQIQILPSAPGFGSQLGEALGGGIGQGIQQGINTRLSQMLERKKEFGKIDKATQSAYGRDWDLLDQNDKLNAIKQSREYFNEGYSLEDSVLQSRYHDELQDLQKTLSQQAQKSPSINQQLQTSRPEKVKNKKGFLEENFGVRSPSEVGKELKKTGKNALEAAEKFAYPFVGQLSQLRDVGSFFINDAVAQDLRSQGISDEEIIQLQEQDRAGKKSLVESYLEATGGVGPGENKIERAVQGALGTFHPAGAAGTLAGEAAEELGGPPIVQAAADALAFVLAIKSGPKVGSAFKANERVISNAEKVAAKTGQKLEEVIAKAQQESGASLEKAAAGDAKEINKLNGRLSREIPKEGQKTAQTEKTVFNPKQAMAERSAFGAKLPESPFEYYFDIEAQKAATEAAKKPETLAKEASNRSRIEPEIESKTGDLQTKKQQLKDLEKDVRSLQGADKSRVETTIGYKKKDIQKTLEELKDLNYELRYNRKRPSEMEIDAQVKKSANEIVAEAKNPTPEGQKRIQRELKADKDYLERADKLSARGELPGEIRPDTHIKMKQKYVEGYNAMISEIREANKALQGSRDAESLKQLSDNRRAIDHLQTRLKRLKGDIVTQTDKLKAMTAIEGPSGAFYRNQIKGLLKDVAEFQKDFFNQPKVKTGEALKTEKVAPKEIKKSGEILEKAGISKKEVQNKVNEIKSQIEKASNGESEKESISDVKKKIEEASNDLIKKTPKGLLRRYLESSGKRALNTLLIYGVTGGGGLTLYQAVNNFRFKSARNQYAKAKDSKERNQLILEWRAKGYSNPKIKNIIQAANAKSKLEKE